MPPSHAQPWMLSLSLLLPPPLQLARLGRLCACNRFEGMGCGKVLRARFCSAGSWSCDALIAAGECAGGCPALALEFKKEGPHLTLATLAASAASECRARLRLLLPAMVTER